MSSDAFEFVREADKERKLVLDMNREEIEQFLMCARVGRIGISLADGPYVVPVGYGYADGRVFFHTCYNGLKMEGIERNPNVCFEVDESISDASLYKSVIVRGAAEIIEGEEMVPYLQKLIDKYRVPVAFDEYMSRPGRNREKEMAAVRICVVTPREITGKMMVRINQKRIK